MTDIEELINSIGLYSSYSEYNMKIIGSYIIIEGYSSGELLYSCSFTYKIYDAKLIIIPDRDIVASNESLAVLKDGFLIGSEIYNYDVKDIRKVVTTVVSSEKETIVCHECIDGYLHILNINKKELLFNSQYKIVDAYNKHSEEAKSGIFEPKDCELILRLKNNAYLCYNIDTDKLSYIGE